MYRKPLRTQTVCGNGTIRDVGVVVELIESVNDLLTKLSHCSNGIVGVRLLLLHTTKKFLTKILIKSRNAIVNRMLFCAQLR